MLDSRAQREQQPSMGSALPIRSGRPGPCGVRALCSAKESDPNRSGRGVPHGGADPALHYAICKRRLLRQQAFGQLMHTR